jgi:hypothetical protein
MAIKLAIIMGSFPICQSTIPVKTEVSLCLIKVYTTMEHGGMQI